MIETEKQYQAAMARIEALLPIVTEDTPADDDNSLELVRLSHLAADYDDKYHPINHSCLTCARFTNSRADVFCGDLNTPIAKDIDIRKGCEGWEQKVSSNWYMLFDDCKYIRYELTREEEDNILREYFGSGDSANHMTKERSELAQHIKWRRVLEL